MRFFKQDEQANFEFGVARDGYLAVKHLLQARPFGAGLPYRYFFKGVHAVRPAEQYDVSIQVEQGKNLIWLRDLNDFSSVTLFRRLS